jgi:heat-inducible transcriptional repressor
MNRSLSADRVSHISDILNERLKGMPLSEVRTQILDHIEAAEQEQSDTFSAAKELAREVFDLRHPDQELYVEGKEKIIEFPDLKDYNQLSTLLRVVEEKNLLASILEKEMKKGGLTVKIGS